jgi:2-amino-4-hydroxy-6-hydroxymethyldihydropteridine diphosphokinase
MTSGTVDPNERPAGTVTAFIGVGSNVGDRAAHVSFAFDALDRAAGIRLVRRSAIHETAPVGPPGQGPYLNAVVELAVGLSPMELLATLLDIERVRGRDRATEIRFGPRTLDLDILTWGAAEPGGARIDSPGLVVPHPRMHDRVFVLAPLSELDPAIASRAAAAHVHLGH